MIDKLEIQIAAVVLNSDSYLTQHQIVSAYKDAFGDIEKGKSVSGIIDKFVREGILIKTDLEYDILFGETLSHQKHGDLDTNDFTFSFDDLINLGPRAVQFAGEHVSELLDAATLGGLPQALSILKALPMDSSRWTGLPAGFRFSAETKRNLVSLLHEADRQLELSGLRNSETAQAKAYIHSALLLAEAPDPQPDLIWELIQRGGALAAIGQFFVALIALFVAGK